MSTAAQDPVPAGGLAGRSLLPPAERMPAVPGRGQSRTTPEAERVIHQHLVSPAGAWWISEVWPDPDAGQWMAYGCTTLATSAGGVIDLAWQEVSLASLEQARFHHDDGPAGRYEPAWRWHPAPFWQSTAPGWWRHKLTEVDSPAAAAEALAGLDEWAAARQLTPRSAEQARAILLARGAGDIEVVLDLTTITTIRARVRPGDGGVTAAVEAAQAAAAELDDIDLSQPLPRPAGDDSGAELSLTHIAPQHKPAVIFAHDMRGNDLLEEEGFLPWPICGGDVTRLAAMAEALQAALDEAPRDIRARAADIVTAVRALSAGQPVPAAPAPPPARPRRPGRPARRPGRPRDPGAGAPGRLCGPSQGRHHLGPRWPAPQRRRSRQPRFWRPGGVRSRGRAGTPLAVKSVRRPRSLASAVKRSSRRPFALRRPSASRLFTLASASSGEVEQAGKDSGRRHGGAPYPAAPPS